MKLLLIDEASMVDDQFWQCIAGLLEAAQQGRGNDLSAAPAADKLGQVHLLTFMAVSLTASDRSARADRAIEGPSRGHGAQGSKLVEAFRGMKGKSVATRKLSSMVIEGALV